jgi:chorismate synthase
MFGNTFGRLLRITTAGESHGPCMTVIVDGFPAGFEVSEADIQPFLNRRRPGQSTHVSQRRETDAVKILSGVFDGKSTGAPITLQVANENARSKDYDDYANVFRPGHADFTYQHKYGHRDHRGGGRSSARETVSWVAAGALAQRYLKQHFAIDIAAAMIQMGSIKASETTFNVTPDNAFFWPQDNQLEELAQMIDELRRAQDSCGGAIKVHACNVPIGLGDPMFAKLDAMLAHAMMSLHAVKAVSIGDGFAVAGQRGSEHRDPITVTGFTSNHAGGVLGGISNGQPIEMTLAIKPTSSIPQAISSINHAGEPVQVTVKGRHDPCVAIRAVPIVEALMALVLLDCILLKECYS